MVRGSAYGGAAPPSLQEISFGGVAGKATQQVIGINDEVGLNFEDLWGPGGVQTLPTSAETLEIVSESGFDNATGTGMRTVRVTGLDVNYLEQSEIVSMDGSNPVELTLQYLRTRSIVAVTAGDFFGTNRGDVTLQVSGGGAVRQLMKSDTGSSASIHYTVPAGRSAQLMVVNVFAPKDDDVVIRSVIRRPDVDASGVAGGSIHLYQNSQILPILAPNTLLEKTDIRTQVKSSNEFSDVTVFQEFLLTDI